MTSLEACQVCLWPAKPKEKLQVHYGGRCCIACKAFFRRIHQASSQPPRLSCESEGQCDLLGISRQSRCKSCRYSRCIKAGMRPQLVPKGEDRKKFTFAKKTKEMACKNVPQPNDSVFDALISQVCANFILAEAEHEIEVSLMCNIIDGHSKPESWNFGHTDAVLQVIGTLKQFIYSFAIKSSCLMSLPSNDVSTLISHNGNLYIQYTVGKYLTRTNGFDQVTRLLGSNMPLMKDNILLLTKPPISFDTLNMGGQFVSIDEPVKMKGFKQCLQDIKEKFSFPCYLNGLLLNYFLFNTDGIETKVDDIKRIRNIYVQCQDLLLYETNNKSLLESLSCLKATLLNMIELSASLPCSSGTTVRKLKSPITLFVTDEEKNFVCETIGNLKMVFQKICPDDDFLAKIRNPRHFNMHFPRVQSLLSKMLRSRFEFISRKLSTKGSLVVSEKTVQLGIFVSLVRANIEPSYERQLAFLRASDMPLDSSSSTDPINVFAMFQRIPNCGLSLDPFKTLFYQLGKFLEQDKVFYLVLLSILFDNNSLLLKMLSHQLSSMPEFALAPNPSQLYSSFLRNMAEVINLFEACFCCTTQ